MPPVESVPKQWRPAMLLSRLAILSQVARFSKIVEAHAYHSTHSVSAGFLGRRNGCRSLPSLAGKPVSRQSYDLECGAAGVGLTAGYCRPDGRRGPGRAAE